MGNRKLKLLAIVAIVVAAGVGGWLFGRNVKNPAEIQLETQAPPASVVTAKVEARELSNDVITRVDASFTDTAQLKLNTNTSEEGLFATGRIPTRGTTVDEGAVILEVSERPYFVFEGELPAFRSMRPGDVGADVAQLEEALARLGHLFEEPDDTFGSETEAALTSLYEGEGYDPAGPSEQEEQTLREAAETVALAQETVDANQKALSDAAKPPSESTVLQREQTWEQIHQRLRDAEHDAANWEDNDPALALAKETAEQATTTWEQARARLVKIRAGDHPDLDEAPTPEDVLEFEALENDAWIELEAARADVVKARSESDADEIAQERLRVARQNHQIEVAQFNESLEGPDLSPQRQTLAESQERLEEAKTALAETEATIGVWLPDYEFMFLRNLPRRVSSVLVERSDVVSSGIPVLEVSGATLRIEGGLSADRRDLVNQGDTITLIDSGVGFEESGVITRLDDVPGGSNDYGSRYYFQVELDNPDVDVEELVSIGNFRAVIPLQRTSGEVLTVPSVAIWTGADNVSRLEVLRPSGEIEVVDITIGLVPRGGGYIEVIPINGDLAIGDDVVTGFSTSTARSASSASDSSASDSGAGDSNADTEDTEAEDREAEDKEAEDTEE